VVALSGSCKQDANQAGGALDIIRTMFNCLNIQANGQTQGIFIWKLSGVRVLSLSPANRIFSQK